MSKQKYVIVSMRENGGGTLVLHNLCRLLNELGEDAKIMYCKNVHYEGERCIFLLNWFLYNFKVSLKYVLESILGPERMKGYFDSPFRKIRRKFSPFVGKDTIVVYYEGIFGNPLNAKKVVRWLLLYNSIYKQDGDRTIGYEKNDLFFTYREVVNDYTLNPKCRLLYIPYMNLELYRRYNFGARNGKCYILRKGKWRTDYKDVSDGIIVDSLSEREKVNVFNKCEYCISYDTQTVYSQIAALCGCISVVVPEEGKSREDYRTANDDYYGEAFGFIDEEINYAISTAPLIMKQWKKNNEKSKDRVIDFILICKDYFSCDI